MRWSLVIIPAGTAQAATTASFEKSAVLIGAGDACDIVLEGLPDIACVVERDGARVTIEPKSDQCQIRLNGQLIAAPAAWPVGVEVQLADYAVQLVLVFDRVEQRRRLGLLTPVALALVAICLIIELGFMVWLPRQQEQRGLWVVELARQRLLDAFDTQRRRLAAWPEPASESVEAMTLALVHGELDELALFLREDVERLSAKQVDAVLEDVARYRELLDKLEAGELYPPPRKLDLEPALERIFDPEVEPRPNPE